MQREVIDFKEGRGERALSGYMHSSIVLEPEGHYCGHWVSVKTPPPPWVYRDPSWVKCAFPPFFCHLFPAPPNPG